MGASLCKVLRRPGRARRKRILSRCKSGTSSSQPLVLPCQVNRNKRSIGLSFQHPAGVDILHRLVKECDVLVENYLPGSLAKYAMDYDTVSKINPGIVYASITGYGQTGPYRNRAGYDVMVEAYVVCFSCLATLICV
jgi:crotonobetainyl-CoA:carnitine CoA-transferase CaiB-like acyl-CoA transferase